MESQIKRALGSGWATGEPPKREFILTDVLRLGIPAAIWGGPYGSQRDTSLIALQLAIAVASGGKWLDTFASAKPRRVLFVSRSHPGDLEFYFKRATGSLSDERTTTSLSEGQLALARKNLSMVGGCKTGLAGLSVNPGAAELIVLDVDDLWRGRKDRHGKPFVDFVAFVEHQQWEGLGIPYSLLISYCRAYRTDVLELVLSQARAEP